MCIHFFLVSKAKFRTLEIIVFTQDYSKLPIKYAIQAPKFGTIAQLSDEIARVSGTKSRYLYICDVYSYRFFKHFKRDDEISSISDRDVIFAIEGSVPLKAKNEKNQEDLPEPNTIDVVVLWKEERVSSSFMSYGSVLSGLDPPVIMTVANEAMTYKQLYDYMLNKFNRFFKTPEQQAEGRDELDQSGGENANPKRLFKIALTDRYGQVSTTKNYSDDEIIQLKHADTVVVILGSRDLEQDVFNKKSAESITEDASCKLGDEEGSVAEKLTLEQCIALHNEKEQLSEEEPW